MKKDETTNTGDEAMIEELLQHLDSEFAQGVYRMSVSFDEKEEEPKNVSRKCCNIAHGDGRSAGYVHGYQCRGA